MATNWLIVLLIAVTGGPPDRVAFFLGVEINIERWVGFVLTVRSPPVTVNEICFFDDDDDDDDAKNKTKKRRENLPG